MMVLMPLSPTSRDGILWKAAAQLLLLSPFLSSSSSPACW
jgi:hypothetical protein